MNRGAFDQLIIFERVSVTGNGYNEEIEGAAGEVTRAYARVRFGSANEQRLAAQEAGVQAATFECASTSELQAIEMTDRIHFDGNSWDITEIAPLDRRTIRFTAVRNR